MLRHELNSEYGGESASATPPHIIYAWIRSFVLLLLSGHDGSAGPSRMPRRSVLCAPALNGDDARR